MAIVKTTTAAQTGCRKCNRVNKPGATQCVGCGASLSGKPRAALAPFTTAPNLDASLSGEHESTELDIISSASTDPETDSEIGSSMDMGDIDSTLDGWLLKGGQTESAARPGFSSKLLSEKQDPKLARLCYDHTAGLLLENEEIEYILTVDRQEASNNHICAIATNKRVFVYNMLGTGDLDLDHPEMCFWQDMDDIYFEEDPEVSLRLIGVGGWHVELKDTHPPQARRLYIYGVDHSERVLRNRVEQHFITHSGAPYVSGPLDESKLESPTKNEANHAANPPSMATSSTTLPIVPRKSRSEASLPAQTPQPAPEAPYSFSTQSLPALNESQAVENRAAAPTPNPNTSQAKPSGGAKSVLSNVMRAVQAADNSTGGLGALANASNPHLSGPNSAPLTGQLPPVGDTGSVVQHVMRMAQLQDSGFISDALSGKLTDVYTSGPLPVPVNQPPAYDNPTGRLPYAFDATTGPMPRSPYDPNSMSGPLANQPQPMPQVMPYLHPSQQPYVQAPYPQPDQQGQYGQPQYGYPPPLYPPQGQPYPQPQYGQQPYGNQYAPYGQQPPPYPPQGQPYPQPQPQPQPANYAAQAQPQPQAEDADDIVSRLQKLKVMLDAGLITDEDYLTKKVQLLEEM